MDEKIVDVHVHPFALMTDDHLLTELDKAGVNVAVLLALVGLDRVLFGSDYPAVGGVTIKSMVDEVKESGYLTEEEKARILGLNAMELLSL